MNRTAQDCASFTRLGKAILLFHTHAENEEQKHQHIEHISKERLKAL
jgi:hypothetical protein